MDHTLLPAVLEIPLSGSEEFCDLLYRKPLGVRRHYLKDRRIHCLDCTCRSCRPKKQDERHSRLGNKHEELIYLVVQKLLERDIGEMEGREGSCKERIVACYV